MTDIHNTYSQDEQNKKLNYSLHLLSSLKSPQSLDPSQTRDSLIQRLLRHKNISSPLQLLLASMPAREKEKKNQS